MAVQNIHRNKYLWLYVRKSSNITFFLSSRLSGFRRSGVLLTGRGSSLFSSDGELAHEVKLGVALLVVEGRVGRPAALEAEVEAVLGVGDVVGLAGHPAPWVDGAARDVGPVPLLLEVRRPQVEHLGGR